MGLCGIDLMDFSRAYSIIEPGIHPGCLSVNIELTLRFNGSSHSMALASRAQKAVLWDCGTRWGKGDGEWQDMEDLE